MGHAQRSSDLQPALNPKRVCAQKYVDPRTGTRMLPVVNALAAPGTTLAMTPGRVYCCILCDRVIDLRARLRLPLPEAPIDLRPVDELPDWLLFDDDDDDAGAANGPAVAARPVDNRGQASRSGGVGIGV